MRPCVQEILTQYFDGKKLCKNVHPDEVGRFRLTPG
jgi:hypothetical protein